MENSLCEFSFFYKTVNPPPQRGEVKEQELIQKVEDLASKAIERWVWCGVVWCGVVWCGVVWCGVVWCGVVWCGVGVGKMWCGYGCG